MMAKKPRGPEVEKGAAVITLDELQRIRMQCSTGNNFTQDQRNAERQDLQMKSKNRIKNWGNTAEATRANRDADRIARLEHEEMEKRKIDAQEEMLLIDARQLALEKANAAALASNDQVKAFKSKLMQCDVIEEREH